MNKLNIDGKEYEIEDEVSDLIVMISEERDDLKNTLMANKEPVAEVPCGVGLDALLEVVKDIRKSDCGGWLKDCNGLFNCRDGREKRNELMRLLDKLYKAASI